MAKFRVPKGLKAGISSYSKLPDSIKNDLDNAIQESPIGLSPPALSEYLIKHVKIQEEVLEEILDLFFALLSIKGDNDNIDEILIDVEKSISGKDIDESTKQHLKKLLSNDNVINVTRKAYGLAFDRQNIISSTKIITDVRPIFGIDDDEEYLGSLIIHNLKIVFHEHGEHKEIYYALDKEDLKRLKEDILRAEKKEQIIQQQLNDSTNFIDLE